MRIIFYFFILFCCLPTSMHAQKVLQLEKFGKAKTKKIYIGEAIEYRIRGTDDWHYAAIEDLIIERNTLVFPDRYVKLDDIDALRYERTWPRPISRQIVYFGAAWSGYALIGTLTDGNPDTNYRASDAIVTGTAWLTAFLLPRIVKDKVTKLGKRRRLRMLDITF